MPPSPPALPAELLDHIVRSALPPRPSLAPLSGLSRACKQTRAIVLCRWFAARPPVRVAAARDWAMVAALGAWIREIACTDAGVRVCTAPLVHLRAASLDFNNHTPFKFPRAYTQILAALPATLTSLTLTSLPIISLPLLHCIAAKFVQLVYLRLSTTGRLVGDAACCCTCCPGDGERQRLLSVQHSPLPDAFADAHQLGHAFGAALAPLAALKTLHLGVYLSPEHALDDHADHNSAQDCDTLGTSNPLARLAECPACCAAHAQSTRQREKDASVALALMLPSLESLEWASCFVLLKCQWDNEDVTESWGTTKLGVRRNDAKLSVERIPEIVYGYEWNCSS